MRRGFYISLYMAWSLFLFSFHCVFKERKRNGGNSKKRHFFCSSAMQCRVLRQHFRRDIPWRMHGGRAKIEDAVVMGKTVIKAGAVVEHCIVAENVVIGENAVVGSMPKGEEHGVATIGSGITIGKGAKIGPNAMVNKNVEDGEEQW